MAAAKASRLAHEDQDLAVAHALAGRQRRARGSARSPRRCSARAASRPRSARRRASVQSSGSSGFSRTMRGMTTTWPGSCRPVRGMRLVGRGGDRRARESALNTVIDGIQHFARRAERKEERQRDEACVRLGDLLLEEAPHLLEHLRRGALEAEDRLLVVADREDRARRFDAPSARRRNPRPAPSPPPIGRGSCPAPRRPGCARCGGRACRAPRRTPRRATEGCASWRSGRESRARRPAAWRRDRPAGWRRRRRAARPSRRRRARGRSRAASGSSRVRFGGEASRRPGRSR